MNEIEQRVAALERCCQVGQVETILRPWSAISRAGTWCKINGRSPLVALGGTSLR
jgi:hypothetical protein